LLLNHRLSTRGCITIRVSSQRRKKAQKLGLREGIGITRLGTLGHLINDSTRKVQRARAVAKATPPAQVRPRAPQRAAHETQRSRPSNSRLPPPSIQPGSKPPHTLNRFTRRLGASATPSAQRALTLAPRGTLALLRGTRASATTRAVQAPQARASALLTAGKLDRRRASFWHLTWRRGRRGVKPPGAGGT